MPFTQKLFLTIAVCFLANITYSQQPLRVGVAGLSHDHIHNLMNQYKKNEVIIVGIAESDGQLVDKYKKQYSLPDSIFYKSLPELLKHVKPDAVLAYNAISEHLSVVESCASKGVPVMVEKPLATTVKDALRIEELAEKYKIQVLTNYETTWYNTNQQIKEMVDANAIGGVRKLIVHDGHQGPKEIGCSAAFLSWLTDPVKNGGGASRDFGCYGANLMTWLMKGQKPISVTAIVHHIKPNVYPKVDDDATIVLEYKDATGIIEASWNWPFGIKDFEVFGVNGYLHALNGNNLQLRMKDKYEDVAVKQAAYQDNIIYLNDVLSGKIKPGNDLASLENNVIVVRILEAATESAKTGKKVML
jgi:predicted dehydrogenase